MNNLGEYIVPVYTWSDDQTAIDKGYTELIRCKDCRWFINKECAIYCLASAFDEAYCYYAERRGADDA